MEPIDFFYSDGVITVTNGSDVATGQFTTWDPGVLPFDIVFVNDGQNGANVVAAVVSATELKLAKPWAGPTLTGVPYFILRWIKHTDPKVYGVRVSDYLTRLKAIPDNIEQVATDINADRLAVEAAMTTLAQIQSDVDADRVAAETAAGTAASNAAAAATSADEAEAWAQAASSGVLPDNGVTNAKLADVPTNTIKGRMAAGTGDPKDLTPAEARTVLGVGWSKVAYTLLASDAAAIDFTLPVGLTKFRFTIDLFAGTDNTSLSFLASRTGGASFLQGASDYSRGYLINNNGTVSAASGNVLGVGAISNILLNAAHVGFHAEAILFQGTATQFPNLRVVSGSWIPAVGEGMGIFGIYIQSTGALNYVRFQMSSGNIRAGSSIFVEGFTP